MKSIGLFALLSILMTSLGFSTMLIAGTVNPPGGPCGTPCCIQFVSVTPSGTINRQNLYRCKLKTMHCSVKCYGECGYVTEVTNPCPGTSSTKFTCGDFACSLVQVCSFDVTTGLNLSELCTSASVDNCSTFTFTTGCSSSARTACESLGTSTCGTVFTIDCAITGGASF